MFGSVLVFLILCLVESFCSISDDDHVLALNKSNDEAIVNTLSGLVRGVKVENGNDDFFAFFSIPYAKPPVGDLRFKPPLPVDPWESILNSTVEGPACIQNMGTYNKSEDCLTLSIYTKDQNTSGKAVYVFIHGGILAFGSASFSQWGPHFLLTYDIVVVAVQFRLGMLGFLNLNLEEAPGNMALLDIIEALKWIKSNIQSFGGNPNQITIGGQSSGSAIAHALVISPMTKDLFQKVIIQGGSALSYRLFSNDTTTRVFKTKEEVNMVNSTDTELLEYLKNLPTNRILQITENIIARYPMGFNEFPFNPYIISIDYMGVVLKNPIELVWDNKYNNIPMLIGVNSNEGSRLQRFHNYVDYVNNHFEMIVPTDLYPTDETSLRKSETASIIKNFYFGHDELNKSTVSHLYDICTDSWMGHVTDYSIRLQSHLNYTSSIYYYMFAVDGAYNYFKIKYGTNSSGAAHSDEFGYLWMTSILKDVVANDNYSDLTRRRMLTMWTNFIKYGNPTPVITEEIPIKWEMPNYPAMNYFLINETLSLQQNPWRERLLFWQRLYGYKEL